MSELHKFIFEGMPVRGMLVRLTDSWQEVLARRTQANEALAPPVRRLLGEMAAAAVLMQANIKFHGVLVLQVFGDGPLKLAVAEVQPDLAFRVTGKVVGTVLDEESLPAMVNVHGQGRCAITLDPLDKRAGQQPYQSVVALNGDQREPLEHMSEVLGHYMLQSQQLDTHLVLAANDELAAGLLIQRLPVAGVANLAAATSAQPEDEQASQEAYRRIATLAQTLTLPELLTLSSEQILHRLFWQEPLRRFDMSGPGHVPRFACTCERQRVGNMLKSLGREELHGILEEQNQVEIACEFCALRYRFDAVDVGALFTPVRDHPPGSAAIN